MTLGVLILIVVIIGVAHIFGSKEKSFSLKVISLDEFQKLIEEKKSDKKYVYVGRTDCPSCETIYQVLCEITKKYELSISYYNTIQDRKKNPEIMYPFLEKIGIQTVPVIVEIENGGITQIFSGEEFISIYDI